MSKYETRLSGAGYELKRVFVGIWRWRIFPALGDGTGLAWGRRGAMRAARTLLRDRKPPRPPCEEAPVALPPLPEPETVREALQTGRRTRGRTSGA
jgi:hypothetical protein